jgi:hypothetical protein
VRSSLVLPADFAFSTADRPLCLSPDGRRLAVLGGRGDQPSQLWIRALDSTVLQPLSGTEGADYAFWSPDGSEIAFFAEGKLKRMPATGGSVTTICAAVDARGGSWGSRGDVVFSPAPFGPLFRVPASGGTPTPVTQTPVSQSQSSQTQSSQTQGNQAPGQGSDRLPHFLPDGRRLLYTSTKGNVSGICVLDLGTGASTRILAGDSDALFAEPGLLLFVRKQNLMAQRFDPDSLALSGEPRLVIEDVDFKPFRVTGAYSVSAHGDVAYASVSEQRQLQWFDTAGRPGDRIGAAAMFTDLGFSPDGKQIGAIIGREGNERDLWILDAERGLGSRLVESISPGGRGVFFADAGTIVYPRSELGGFTAFKTVLHPLDGSSPEREYSGGWGEDISRDGVWMIYGEQSPGTGFDLLCRRVDGAGEPLRLAASAANELFGRFSPDGKWIAFLSDTTGRAQLFMQAFPGPGRSQQLTTTGVANDPALAWLDDGRIVYRDVADPRKLWALAVDTRGATPVIGTPLPMFGGKPIADGPFGISADGTRALVAFPCDESGRHTVNLIQNLLRARGEEVR